MERSADWQQFVLDRPMAEAPGTVFYYNSGNSQLLSAILTKVTGKSALDYARETLFGPLGIEDVLWRGDPQGVSGGGAGLYLHPRDMAKLGYLWLRGGAWEGRQILPASWIEGVRQANVDMRESWARELRYGSQFWVMPGRDAYFAVGYDRQLIVVMPKLDIVAVMTGAARFSTPSGTGSSPRYGFGNSGGSSRGRGDLGCSRRGRSGGRGRTRRPGEAGRHRQAGAGRRLVGAGEGRLRQDLAVRQQRPSVQVHHPELDDPVPSFEYEADGVPAGAPIARFGGPIGFDGHYRVGGRMRYGPSAARGAWSDDGKSLVLEVQTLGNDDAARLTYVFDGKTVELNFEMALGFKLKLQGQADD